MPDEVKTRIGKHLKIPWLWVSVLASVILLVIAALALFCRSPPRPASASDLLPPGVSAVEEEIVQFVLDFIVEAEIRTTAESIETTNFPWAGKPPSANIIVWAPPVEMSSESTPYTLDMEAPIAVWWYASDDLSRVRNPVQAIERYRTWMSFGGSGGPFAWGYYTLAILSVDESEMEAEVYIGVYCGPVCGHGVLYTLRRGSEGKWEVVDWRQVWVS